MGSRNNLTNFVHQRIYHQKRPHCKDTTENSTQIFPEMKLRGLVPDSYIHVSVSDSYIPRISLPIFLLQQNSWTDHCMGTQKIKKTFSTGVSHIANLLNISFRYVAHFNALFLKTTELLQVTSRYLHNTIQFFPW